MSLVEYKDTVFFIGNGASRQNFDLNKLKEKGIIIGCNALYRDFIPDILIVLDGKMMRELKTNNYKGKVLTSKGQGVRPENTTQWRTANFRTSGAFGLQYVTKVINPLRCYTLGMDGYPGNIYRGTPCYSVSGNLKFDKIVPQYVDAVKNSTVEVVNVNTVDSWKTEIPNYRFIGYDRFEEELKTI